MNETTAATMNASRTSAEAPRPTGDNAPPARQRILMRLPMAAVTSQDVPKDGRSRFSISIA